MEETDLGYNPNGSWRSSDPFVRVYVYPKNAPPYVVKGGLNECETFVKTRGKFALMHIVIYKNRISRLVLRFNIPSNITSIKPYLLRKVYKYPGRGMYLKHWELTAFQNGIAFKKRFRRPPRGWPKCLNKIIGERKIQ